MRPTHDPLRLRCLLLMGLLAGCVGDVPPPGSTDDDDSVANDDDATSDDDDATGDDDDSAPVPGTTSLLLQSDPRNTMPTSVHTRQPALSDDDWFDYDEVAAEMTLDFLDVQTPAELVVVCPPGEGGVRSSVVHFVFRPVDWPEVLVPCRGVEPGTSLETLSGAITGADDATFVSGGFGSVVLNTVSTKAGDRLEGTAPAGAADLIALAHDTSGEPPQVVFQRDVALLAGGTTDQVFGFSGVRVDYESWGVEDSDVVQGTPNQGALLWSVGGTRWNLGLNGDLSVPPASVMDDGDLAWITMNATLAGGTRGERLRSWNLLAWAELAGYTLPVPEASDLPAIPDADILGPFEYHIPFEAPPPSAGLLFGVARGRTLPTLDRLDTVVSVVDHASGLIEDGWTYAFDLASLPLVARDAVDMDPDEVEYEFGWLMDPSSEETATNALLAVAELASDPGGLAAPDFLVHWADAATTPPGFSTVRSRIRSEREVNLFQPQPVGLLSYRTTGED